MGSVDSDRAPLHLADSPRRLPPNTPTAVCICSGVSGKLVRRRCAVYMRGERFLPLGDAIEDEMRWVSRKGR